MMATSYSSLASYVLPDVSCNRSCVEGCGESLCVVANSEGLRRRANVRYDEYFLAYGSFESYVGELVEIG